MVIADTRRLADCFGAIDFFDNRRLPYVIAVNHFEGAARYHLEDVREALAVSRACP